jgi:hypothetical protein
MVVCSARGVLSLRRTWRVSLLSLYGIELGSAIGRRGSSRATRRRQEIIMGMGLGLAGAGGV